MQRARRRLAAHRADRRRRRPDEGHARGRARLGEVGVLGQEAVARVDARRRRSLRTASTILSIDQVALARGRRADGDRLVGHAHVQRAAVGLGVDGDRARCPARGRRGSRGRRSRRGWRSGPCVMSTGRHAISIPQVRSGCAARRRPRSPCRCAPATLAVPMCGDLACILWPRFSSPSAHVARDVRLDAQHLGEPLVVDARRRHRRLRVQLPVDARSAAPASSPMMIVGPPAAPDHHLHPTVAVDARWSASSTTAGACRGATAFCSLPIRPNALGTPGLKREVVHLIVEHDAGLARDQVGAEAEVHGRRQRHRVPLGVDDRQVRRPAVLVQRRRRARACRRRRAAARRPA